MNTIARPNRPGRNGGFTLIELLVAVLLLSITMSAIVTLWSVSRKITERSRDTAEYYAIARQELERDRFAGFDGVPAVTTVKTTDYDQNGSVVATGSVTAFYRAISTTRLVATSPIAGVDEPKGKQLGVQEIAIYTMSNGTAGPVVYQTTMFFTSAGV
jgi:prepilin-type N-terminal cleavage/methylation domain-containing protein